MWYFVLKPTQALFPSLINETLLKGQRSGLKVWSLDRQQQPYLGPTQTYCKKKELSRARPCVLRSPPLGDFDVYWRPRTRGLKEHMHSL